MANPRFHDWIGDLQQKDPSIPATELAQYYRDNYGPIREGDYDQWASGIRQKDADIPDEELRSYYTQTYGEPEPEPGVLSDLGTRVLQGVGRIPGALTGIVDAVDPLTYLTGHALVSEGADWLGEKTGFQPAEWASSLDQNLSSSALQAKRDIDQAWEDGSAGDIAGAYLRNPIQGIGGLVAEAIPMTAAGGFIGRGIGLAGKALQAGAAEGSLAGKVGQFADRYRFAAGEGAIAGGATTGAVLDQDGDPRLAGLAGLGAAVTTGVLGQVGAKVSQRLGLIDLDVVLAGGQQGALGEARRSLGTRILGGAAVEGLAEELPQSITEQMWQNAALGNPLMEGTARAGVEGALAGAVMGGGMNIARGRPTNILDPEPDQTDTTGDVRTSALPPFTAAERAEDAKRRRALTPDALAQHKQTQQQYDEFFRQADAEYGAPSGQMTVDHATGRERELTVGELIGLPGFSPEEVAQRQAERAKAKPAPQVRPPAAATPAAKPPKPPSQNEIKRNALLQDSQDILDHLSDIGRTAALAGNQDTVVAPVRKLFNELRQLDVRTPEGKVHAQDYFDTYDRKINSRKTPPKSAAAMDELVASFRFDLGMAPEETMTPAPVVTAGTQTDILNPTSNETNPDWAEELLRQKAERSGQETPAPLRFASIDEALDHAGLTEAQKYAYLRANNLAETGTVADGMSTGEIAAERGVSPQAASKALSAANERMRSRIAEDPQFADAVAYLDAQQVAKSLVNEAQQYPELGEDATVEDLAAPGETMTDGVDELFQNSRVGDDEVATAANPDAKQGMFSGGKTVFDLTSIDTRLRELATELGLPVNEKTFISDLPTLVDTAQNQEGDPIATRTFARLVQTRTAGLGSHAEQKTSVGGKTTTQDTGELLEDLPENEATPVTEDMTKAERAAATSQAEAIRRAAEATKLIAAAAKAAQPGRGKAGQTTKQAKDRLKEKKLAEDAAAAQVKAWLDERRGVALLHWDVLASKHPELPEAQHLTDDEKDTWSGFFAYNEVTQPVIDHLLETYRNDPRGRVPANTNGPRGRDAATGGNLAKGQRPPDDGSQLGAVRQDGRAVPGTDDRGGQVSAPAGVTFDAAGNPVVAQPKSLAATQVRKKRRVFNPQDPDHAREAANENPDVKFGEAAGQTQQGTTRQAFERVVQDVLGKANNWRITVHDTVDQARAAGVPEAHLRGTSGRGAYGWVETKDGKTHATFILERVQPGQELSAFLHEVGVHMGLENILDAAQIDRLFRKINDWAAKNDGSQESQIAKAALARVADAKTSATQSKSEVMAYFVEEAVRAGVDPTAMSHKSELARWFRALWAAFKVALRKLGVRNIDGLTSQHVVDLAYGAARMELAGHWHGSLPGFRQFDSSYMSSGAGDQWYSWGHYVAKRKGVAEHYREMVARKAGGTNTVLLDGKDVSKIDAFDPQYPEDFDAFVDYISEVVASGDTLDNVIDRVIDDEGFGPAVSDWLRDNRSRFSKDNLVSGNLHRVDANVLPEETMHWDKPLSEQPQQVQDAIKQASTSDNTGMVYLHTPFGDVLFDTDEGISGADLYARMVALEKGDAMNPQAYEHTSSKAASMFLDSIGIKAMEHWDEPSRSKVNEWKRTKNSGAAQLVDADGVVLTPANAFERTALDMADFSGDLDAALVEANYGTTSAGVKDVLQRWKSEGVSIKRVAAPFPTDVSTNLVVFNDKNILTLGRAPGGDLSNVRYGMAGVKAKTFDQAKFEDAVVGHISGANPEDTWYHHGFYRGVDKQWRFEFDDSQASLNHGIEAMPAVQFYPDPTPGESGLVRRDADTGQWIPVSPDMVGAPLGKLIDHPEMFKAYPDLENVPVVNIDNDDIGGFFHPGANFIALSPKSKALENISQLDVLLHEAQHWIQNYEGWAAGGTPESAWLDATIPQRKRFLQPLLAEGAKRRAAADAQRQLVDRIPLDPFGIVLDAEDAIRTYEELEMGSIVADYKRDRQYALDDIAQTVEGVDYAQASTNLVEALDLMRELGATPKSVADVKRRLAEYIKNIDADLSDLKPYSVRPATLEALGKHGVLQRMYRNIVGETEAYDIMDRRPMTPLERRTKFPEQATDPIFTRRGPMAMFGEPSWAPPAQIQKTIGKLPKPLQTPTADIVDAVRTAANKTHLGLAFTKDLADVIRAKAPAFKDAVDRYMTNIQAAKVERITRDQSVSEILTRYHALKTEALQKPVAKFLADARVKGEWGYDPRQVTAANLEAWSPPGYEPNEAITVNPAMAEAFGKLTPAQQRVAVDVNKLLAENFQTTQKLITQNINRVYDKRVDQLQTRLAAETDPAKQAKLTKSLDKTKADQAQALKAFDKKLTKTKGPYAPLKRQGNYVVQAFSPELKALYDLGEERTTADNKRYHELRRDETHYTLEFVANRNEARKRMDALRETFGENVDAWEKTSWRDNTYVGMPEIDRLRSLVTEGVGEPGNARLVRDVENLALQIMADTHARQSQHHAKLTPGYDPDMIRAFVSQARADAHHIANLTYLGEINDAIHAMTRMVEDPKVRAQTSVDRDTLGRMVSELHRRWGDTLKHEPSPLVDRLAAVSSTWHLLLSPAYYFQNATQVGMMSVPWMAGTYGWVNTQRATLKAYKDILPMVKDKARSWEHFDTRLVPEDVRHVIAALEASGQINIFMDMELGQAATTSNTLMGKAGRTFDQTIRRLPAKMETINRVVTAIAAYRLATEAGPKQMSVLKATAYAGKVLDITHGDYDGFNAPRWISPGMWGNYSKLLFQFRKFQLIQLAFYARMFNDMTASHPPEVRKAAGKALAFSLAHTTLAAGAMGLPALGTIQIIASLFGDDDEPNDKAAQDYKLRKAMQDGGMPDDMVDLVLGGLPTLLGIDMTGTLGSQNMLTPLPYTQLDPQKQGNFEALATAALGPTAGLAGKLYRGFGDLQRGEYYSGFEKILGSGLGDAVRAARLATKGEQTYNTDQAFSPDELGAWTAISAGLGFTPEMLSKRWASQRVVKSYETTFDRRTSEIKRAYSAAVESKSRKEIRQIRQEWLDLQQAKRDAKVKPSPMSELVKAPMEQRKRERQTTGGVKWDRGSRGLVEDVTGAFN